MKYLRAWRAATGAMVLSLVFLVTVSAAAATSISFNAAAPNLIANGDFAANATRYRVWPGYSAKLNPPVPWHWISNSSGQAGVNGPDAAAGSAFAPDSSAGVRDFAFLQGARTTLSQTVPTAGGKSYTLTFAAAARGTDTPANHDRLRVVVTANTGAAIAAATPAITHGAFQKFAITFTARGAATTVQFTNASPAGALAGGTIDFSDVRLLTRAEKTSSTVAAYEYSPIGLRSGEINRRADSLLRRMTLPEKLRMLSGSNSGMSLSAIHRLGIPPLRCSDATVGVVEWGPSTAYPAAPCLTSTWNRKLARAEGRHIGLDARAKGVNILLGPGMNILRQPQNGRSMEYIGGEDPYLAAQMVVPYIQGLQSQDVAACAKHFVGNEIETMRPWINCIIRRRTLEEIYFPPFRAAVRQGHAWALMTAANWVNGHYAGANAFDLTTALRKRWGFKGMVMTDWCGAYNTLHSLAAGLNVEMPAPHAYAPARIIRLLHQHKVTMALINQRVREILRMIVAMGFNDPGNPFNHRPANTSGDAAVVNQVAAEGTVLLKNKNNILPLNPNQRMNVVFIGPWATRVVTGGGGSSHVNPAVKPVTLVDAVKHVAGPGVHLRAIPWKDTYRQFWGHGPLTTPHGKAGVVADYYANAGFAGTPQQVIQRGISLNAKAVFHGRALGTSASRASQMMQALNAAKHGASLGKNPISVVWKAAIHPKATGAYSFICAVSGSAEVYLDGRRIIDLWLPTWQYPAHPLKGALTTLHLRAGQTYQVRVVFRSIGGRPAVIGFGWVPRKAVHLFTPAQRQMIRHANVVIACMGFNQTIQREQADRPYNLTGPQNEYLRTAAMLNPHTVAVVYAGAGVGMEKWIHHVAALLWGWYPGQTGNLSIAKIIFGSIDPSGHLPDTFSRHWRDEAAYHHFPGYPGVFNHRWQAEPAYSGFPSGIGARCQFVEGIDVGYRWYDYKHIRPLFPFGFGLSYTTFSLRNLRISSAGSGQKRQITARLTVANTGHRTGAEIVQLYVHPPQGGKRRRVVQKLEGFKRVTLAPGQAKTVVLHLTWKQFATFSTRANAWIVPPGVYGVAAGSSSADEPLHEAVVW